MHRLELKLPASPQYLGIALRFVSDCAQIFGFADAALRGIELAAEEAIANSIHHRSGIEDEPELLLTCRRVPRGMQVAIRDRGIPYDPAAAPQYSPDHLTLDDDGSGLGLFLMKHGVDEVAFRNLGRDGKEVVLVKHFELPPAEGEPVDVETSRSQVRDLFKLRRSSPVAVRAFEPRDAVGVTRCAYLMHGYHFYDGDIYDPAALNGMAGEGTMSAAIAVTPDQEIAVFSALLRHEPDAPIAELTYALVNPRIRAPGAFERVIAYLSAAHSGWLKGIYTYVFTHHAHTQSLAAKLGYSPVCLLLNVDDSALRFHFLDGTEQGRTRISNVVLYRYLEPSTPALIHPPSRHREIIDTLYRGLGVEPRIGNVDGSSELGSAQQSTRLETRVNHGIGHAWITVVNYGPDLREQVLGFVKQCRHAEIRFIEMRLPLRLPQTAACTGVVEALGFFFCGVLPLGKHGDYLVLQNPADRVIDLQSIKVSSPDTRVLLDYVIACERSSLVA